MPFEVKSELVPTNLRGMGNKNLSTYGYVKCKIVYENRTYFHYFLVLPDEEAIIPFLIGRDLLRKMNIHLCQLKDNSYSVNDLLNLNTNKTENVPENTVIDALKSFNLFKSPHKNEILKPITNACKINANENEVENNLITEEKTEGTDITIKFKVDDITENVVGFVSLTEDTDLEDINEIVLLVCAIETDDNNHRGDLCEQNRR